jgi:hypothetical protein
MDGMRNAIELEIVNAQEGADGAIAAAEDGTDAGGEFGKGEGLGEIIVGAGVEAANAFFDERSRGDDEHREIGLLGTNATENVETGGAGRAQVKEHDVVGLLGSETLGFHPSGNHLHGKLLLHQPLVQKIRQRCVIFSDKNSHQLTRSPGSIFGRG